METGHHQPDQSTKEKLIEGYEKMLDRCRTQIDEWHEKSAPKVQELLSRAKEKAIELGELTEEEAQKISEYLNRDLQDAAVFLSDAKQSLKDWLLFDWNLVEKPVWKSFSGLTNKALDELHGLKQRLRLSGKYHAGEITAAGSLKCASCEQVVNFHKVSHIPPCPKCHKTVFVRAKVAEHTDTKEHENS